MATEKNAKKTTEVVTTGGYGEIANMNFLSDAMDDDCAGLDFQLERIKLPSGGMTAFEAPAGDGENTDLTKEIEEVIIYNHPVNSYYLEAYKGETIRRTAVLLMVSAVRAIRVATARHAGSTSSAVAMVKVRPARTGVCFIS